MVNEARPPVMELKDVEYEDISFKGTFANQDTNHLMAFVRQLLTERKCLSQMSPAFTLYDKQYFHITSA